MTVGWGFSYTKEGFEIIIFVCVLDILNEAETVKRISPKERV